VSRLLRDLEMRLGLTLFDRRANALVPTPEATLLFGEVDRYALGIAAIASFAAELRARRRGSLKVVALPALAMGFLPRFVADFITGRDLGEVYVHGMPSHLVIEAVLAGQVEIGIAAGAPERPSIKLTPIRSNAVVVMQAHHPLAARRRIRAGDLRGERVVTLAEPSILSLPGGRPMVRSDGNIVTTPLSGIACALVQKGGGVAIVDPFSASDYHAHGLAARPFAPAIELRMGIVTNSNRRLSALSQDFIDAFVKHAEAVTRQ
jgi:DNA-binding transcriptional LysR family regulator